VAAQAIPEWFAEARELRNVIERAVILAQGDRLKVGLPISGASASSRSLAMRDAEREPVASVLETTCGQVRGKDGAAEILQLDIYNK
jgi:DNA-binding NtrC family response regulator